MHFRRIVDGPFPVTRISDRREAAKYLLRRGVVNSRRTPPAESIVIRKLEESVGQPLLVRGARQVKLTDAGELLRDYAERLLNLRDEIQKGMEDLKSLGRGEL